MSLLDMFVCLFYCAKCWCGGLCYVGLGGTIMVIRFMLVNYMFVHVEIRVWVNRWGGFRNLGGIEVSVETKHGANCLCHILS